MEAQERAPAYLNVTDIAGLVRGASSGEGLGNAFLSHIQAVDGIFHMVRVFESDEVTHVDDSVDPVRDLETIVSELCLKDLSYVKQVCEYEHLQAKKAGKVMPPIFVNTMGKVTEFLEKNLILSKQTWATQEVQKINEFLPRLISTKPMIYLLNLTKKAFLTKKNKWLPKIFEWVQTHGGGTIVPLSVELEEEFVENKENLAEFKAELQEQGFKNVDSSLPKIIKAGYSELNLIQFFTTGPTEVRAWTVFKGATAPNCAGVIHNDLEKCFIKAEVVSYEDFIAHTPENNQKSMSVVKAAGKYRQEGKAYVVQDGEILHIMHNAKK